MQPVIDPDYIVNAISEKIEQECAKSQQAILSAVGSMMASLKGEMEVKLTGALRAHSKPSDDEDDKFTFSPMSSIEQIHELEKKPRR